MTRAYSQTGSAFIIILIAIAMFAALSYAVSQGGSISQSTLTKEQAKLAAREITSYADTVAKAVHKLRLAGCTETQISFEIPNPPGGWAANGGAPADKSCTVFNINGGKVQYTPIETQWLYNTTTTVWWPNGETAVTNIGTASPELILWARNLKRDVCDEINNLQSLTGAMTETVGTHTTNFAGTYALVANGIGDDVGTAYLGKSTGCILDATGGKYYAVLIAR